MEGCNENTGLLWPGHKYAEVCIPEEDQTEREREREGERSTRSGLFVEIGKGVFAGLPKETTQGV